MKFAVTPPVGNGVTADPDWMAGFARHAEACGFESLVMVEHPVLIGGHESTYPYAESGRMPLPLDCPLPDPLDLLTFVAAHTERLGLATGVLVLPAHHPVVLAKRLATLDVLSRGRLRLCVGLGWMREELEACNVEFGTRGVRADEMIDAMRALWSAPDGADHDGHFFSFRAAHSHPQPVQAGGVPIHVGGHSHAAARRAGVRGDGFQPLGLSGEALDAALAEMRRAATEAGRDPDHLEVTMGDRLGSVDRTAVEQAAARGVDRLVLSTTGTNDLDEATAELTDCSQRLGLR